MAPGSRGPRGIRSIGRRPAAVRKEAKHVGPSPPDPTEEALVPCGGLHHLRSELLDARGERGHLGTGTALASSAPTAPCAGASTLRSVRTSASESPPRTEPSRARGSPSLGAIRPWTGGTSTSRVPAPRRGLPPIEPDPTLAMREHQLRDATRGDRRNPSAPSVVDVPLDRADRHAEQTGHRPPAPVPLVQPMQERSNALDRHAPTRPMTSSSPWQHPSLMSGPEHVWLSSDPTGMLQAVGGPVRRLPTAAVTHPVRWTAHGATPPRGVRVLPPIGHRSTVYTVGMIHVTHLPSIAAVSEPARRARLVAP